MVVQISSTAGDCDRVMYGCMNCGAVLRIVDDSEDCDVHKSQEYRLYFTSVDEIRSRHCRFMASS